MVDSVEEPKTEPGEMEMMGKNQPDETSFSISPCSKIQGNI